MMQEIPLPFDSLSEFTEIASAISNLRAQLEKLRQDGSLLSVHKSRIIAPVLARLDDLIDAFNNDFLVHLDMPDTEEAGIEKMQLRLKMLLTCLSVEKETLDTLALHGSPLTLFVRAGTRLGTLVGGAFAGLTLAGPWGTFPGACAGHIGGSSLVNAEAVMPESAKRYLQVFRAIQSASTLSPKVCTPETCQLLNHLFASKAVRWLSPDDILDAPESARDTLYIQLTHNGSFLCREGASIYNLTPILEAHRAPFRARLDDNIIRIAYISTALLELYQQPRLNSSLTEVKAGASSSSAMPSSSSSSGMSR